MSLEIRAARPGEEGVVLHFIRQLAEYEKLAHQVVATEAALAEALFGRDPKARCELAFWNGTAAGFALWFYNFSTFKGRAGIYLEDLFVAPEFRGYGIGKALLAHLAQRCRAEGLPRLQWWVLNWNRPAIDFYESLGAVAQDEWMVYRVSDAALERLGA